MSQKIVIPPFLQKGDLLGMLCPAGYMPAKKIETAITVMTRDWGFRIRKGKTLGHQYHYFSGTDKERRKDLQNMLDDPEVRAIYCARGGYGLSRIIHQLDWRAFKKHPKWIIGFSDVTVLHAHVFSTLGIATLHAPMANAFNHLGYKGPYVRSLYQALTGNLTSYTCPAHSQNRTGVAKGFLAGGNLSLLAHLTGTPSQLKTKNCILFLEDVAEHLYHIDRMLYQLKRSGQLSSLAGLVIGGFTELKDTDPPFGKTVYEIIRDIVHEYDYPVCFDFPVSHDKENYALKVGGKYILEVKRKAVTLAEL